MKTGRHTVTCNEDEGTLVRVNGICVAYFTSGWSKRKNIIRGRELAQKIFEAIQFVEDKP